MIRKLRLPPGAYGLLAILIGLLAPSATLRAQENSDCLECHADKGRVIQRDGKSVPVPFVDPEHFANSVHPEASCTSCHEDLDGVDEFPHEPELEKATCSMCHDDSFESIEAYMLSTHGTLVEEGNENAPRCADCHGFHEIRSRTDPKSMVFVTNIPATCSQCHAEGQPIARSEGVDPATLEKRYLDRIHGAGIFRQGLTVAPVCTTCHGAHGILPPTNEASPIHKDKVNDGCAKCHTNRESVHEGIVAPELWSRPGAVPICVDCHQPHTERKVTYQTNMSNAECLECHGTPALAEAKGRGGLFVQLAKFANSIHGRNLIACSQCHTRAAVNETKDGCGGGGGAVNCAACHDSQVERYQRGVHGSLRAKGDEDAPGCVGCHGSHEIFESKLPDDREVSPTVRQAILDSPTHRRNIPDLCARCHREGAPAAVRNTGGDAQKLAHYRESIHGRGLLESGLIASANCVDCHSAHLTLPPSDPDSSVHPANIVDTCGRCHDGINEKFRSSIHSPLGNPDFVAAEGEPGLPHCNDCHSAHSIARTDEPDFRRGILNQCGHCHEKITETYFDTYHGKVTALGETVAAQCYDCHGSHDIRPKDDPKSTLNPDNIADTCAQCHAGSHANFGTYLAHATHDDPERYPVLYWSYMAMSLLLAGVFAFFGMHLLAWLPRSLKLRREHAAKRAATPPEQLHAQEQQQFMRFRRYDRNLHRLVIISFLALGLTGMTLKFAETGWAHVLNTLLGGVETAGWIHRACGVITFAYFALHLADLLIRFMKSGKSVIQFFFDPATTMVPMWRDVEEMIGTFKWFFGLGPRPRYGKWTYWEKFDYFAVFWGVLIIGFSGLLLWFPELATRFLPGWTINVATIIHSEEALLATGFIFTIHFFNTHLRPEKFPMDPVVFTGRMTIEELKTDKPRYYDELVKRGELDQHLTDPPTFLIRRAAFWFGYTALTIGLILVVLLFYGVITVGL